MKESPEITRVKEKWAEEYFTRYPKHSADKCNAKMRKKFAHGLNWTTVQEIKMRVVANRADSAKTNGHHVPAVSTVQVDDKIVAFRAALSEFRNNIRAINGVTLRSLSIRLDESTGKWDIEYDLVNKEQQVQL